jgi:hypothetical protein
MKFFHIIQIAYRFLILNIGLFWGGGGVVFYRSTVVKWSDEDEDTVLMIWLHNVDMFSATKGLDTVQNISRMLYD